MLSENKPLKLLFVARQPGTLHAFESLIVGLKTRDLWKNSYLSSLGPLPSSAFQHSSDFKMLKDFSEFVNFASPVFDFIITGTSLNREDFLYWEWAAKKNIPCLAFHDQWVNTSPRFENVKVLPTVVLVVDEEAKQLVLESNPLTRVEIMGSPLWDDLKGIYFERQTKLNPHLFIFASEPACLESFKDENGFDDLDSLYSALIATNEFAKNKNIMCTFLIKLHPVDTHERIETFLKPFQKKWPFLNIGFIDEIKHKMFTEAAFLLGMRSMLLVEAAIAGVPVISFQPNRKTKSPATDRVGIEIVTKESESAAAFQKAMLNKPNLPQGSSLDRFLEITRAYLPHENLK